MKVCKIFQWDAAHRLVLPYKSPCANVHGHTYKVEVEVEGPINEVGMVVDFSELKRQINNIGFDHTFLNDTMDENPTAENLVLSLKKQIDVKFSLPEFKGLRISRIRIWETPSSWAEKTWKKK